MFYGWRIVGVTLFSQAVQAGLLIYSFGILVLPFAEAFGARRETLMLGTALLSLSTNLISPFAGVRADRASLRDLMTAGTALMGLGFVALAATQATWQMLAVFALILPFGNLLLGQLSASALITQWFNRRRGRALGISAVGTSIGGLLFPPLIAWLFAAWGWRAALLAIGFAIWLVGLPLIRHVVVDRPELAGLTPDGAQPGPRAAEETLGREWTSAQILRSRAFWVITVTIGLVLAVYLAVLANLVPHATDQGIAATRAASLMSVLAGFAIAGKLGFGALADRLDLRHALWLAIALMALGLALLLGATGFAGLLAACVPFGLAAGGQLPVWGALVARGFGRRSFGRALGLMNPAMMPITLVSAPLAGGVFDRTGSYTLAFQVFLGALAVAAATLTLLRFPGEEAQ